MTAVAPTQISTSIGCPGGPPLPAPLEITHERKPHVEDRGDALCIREREKSSGR
jgi:hypothetical protein